MKRCAGAAAGKKGIGDSEEDGEEGTALWLFCIRNWILNVNI